MKTKRYISKVAKFSSVKGETLRRRVVLVAVSLVLTALIVSPTWALGRPIGPPEEARPINSTGENTTNSTSTSSSAASTTPSKSNKNTQSGQTQAARLRVLQTRANAEIERRIGVLNKLTTLVNSSAKLNTTDKGLLANEINGELTGDSTFMGLNNLKAKIDADTSLSVALQDKKSIVTEYRVFVFIVPQVHIVSTADQQQTIETKLSSFATKLQTRITDARNQGKDVSTLQTELSNMQESVSSSTSLSSSVEQKVLALRPADYDGNTTILKQYRQDLQTAHQDGKIALADAKQIVQGLEQL